MIIRQLWTIARKEIVDNLRDRRSMLNALMTVLMVPLLYIFMFGFMNRAFSEQARRPLDLPVVGAEHAPNLIAFLEQNNVNVLPGPDEPETAVRSGDVSLVLVISAEYGEAFAAGRPAPLQLLQDASNQNSDVAVSRASGLLQQYGQQIAALRLIARGVNPAITTPLLVERVDVSPEDRGGAGFILNLLPVVMITAAFFGGFYLAVDTTAGERERDSLEPLLLNPVRRSVIVLGKYLATFAFALLGTILATSTFLLLLRVPQVQDFTNIRVTVGNETIVIALLIMLPVVLMAVAIEILIASYAHSFKDAQNYVQVVALIGFMPSIFLSILPFNAQSWMYAIPTVSQLLLINQASRGEMLSLENLALATAVTLIVGLAAFAAAVRLYSQERIIMGK
jgi:sodium transport system permease protein